MTVAHFAAATTMSFSVRAHANTALEKKPPGTTTWRLLCIATCVHLQIKNAHRALGNVMLLCSASTYTQPQRGGWKRFHSNCLRGVLLTCSRLHIACSVSHSCTLYTSHMQTTGTANRMKHSKITSENPICDCEDRRDVHS